MRALAGGQVMPSNCSRILQRATVSRNCDKVHLFLENLDNEDVVCSRILLHVGRYHTGL